MYTCHHCMHGVLHKAEEPYRTTSSVQSKTTYEISPFILMLVYPSLGEASTMCVHVVLHQQLNRGIYSDTVVLHCLIWLTYAMQEALHKCMYDNPFPTACVELT